MRQALFLLLRWWRESGDTIVSPLSRLINVKKRGSGKVGAAVWPHRSICSVELAVVRNSAGIGIVQRKMRGRSEYQFRNDRGTQRSCVEMICWAYIGNTENTSERDGLRTK